MGEKPIEKNRWEKKRWESKITKALLTHSTSLLSSDVHARCGT